jgi:parallel beta-helix repeat protein
MAMKLKLLLIFALLLSHLAGAEEIIVGPGDRIQDAIGILHWKADDNTIINNIARENTYAGIALSEHCRNNTISGNSAVKSIPGDGIRVSGSNNAFVDNNASDDNKIEGNNASYNLFNGIDLDDCRKNVVRENRADYNEWGGIGLYFGCEENSIEDNEVGYNTWAGITLGECDGNVVTGNNATRNVMGGIKLQGSYDNLLFHNDLVENAMEGAAVKATSPLIESLLESAGDLRDERAKNAYDDAINQWDNGTTGNYFSDFDCTDSGGDGICDSGHAIPGGESVDRYPLARSKSSG